MTNERLPLDRLASLPRSGDSEKPRPVAQERFSDEEMTRIRTEFGQRMKTAFDGANNAEIARRCKTTDATVKAYADGATLPSFEILLQMHFATGVNLHWLMTGKGQRRAEFGDVFTEDEELEIQELARASGRSFNETVRRLATGAVEVLEKLK